MIREVQHEHKEWSRRNFPAVTIKQQLLGIVEEVGELSHAVLKREQGIRLPRGYNEAARDAIGDIVIFILGFCTSHNWDLEDIVQETWDEVKQRDWVKYPKTGRP